MNYSNLLLVFAFAITLVQSYKLQKQVLNLVSDDFPDIFKQFPQLIIYFCKKDVKICQKMNPIYHQIAKQFNKTKPELSFAKLDIGDYSTVAAIFNVNYYPTFIYFVNGQKLHYRGQINKQDIVTWISQKLNERIASIDQNALEILSSSQKVRIVFHGDLSSNEHKAIFEQISLSDDYNDYYKVEETNLPQGTVQIFRPFGEPVITVIDKQLKNWIKRHSRPVISRFDNQTFADIFYDKSKAVILFQPQNIQQQLNTAFIEVAQDVKIEQKKDFLFISIEASNEHYKRLSNLTKIDPVRSPVIIFDPIKGHKYVLIIQAADLTSQKISSFISQYQGQKLKKYGLAEQILYQNKLENENLL